MSCFVVGLTGGVGSGKSTVANLFVKKGIVQVDTDAIAHELTGPGGAAMPALVAEFGPAVVNDEGALDRAAMRQMVFADQGARARLEGILHPRIRQISADRCRAAASPYVILAIPLLVESGVFRQCCNRIVTVDCSESLQIERVMARSALSVDEVKAIMAAQSTRAQRLAVADDVVFNDDGLDALYEQVDALHQKYLRVLAEIPNASC